MYMYLNMKNKQFIQILIPEESKYIDNKFSKPKFGKLYIFNCFKHLIFYYKNQPNTKKICISLLLIGRLFHFRGFQKKCCFLILVRYLIFADFQKRC